MTPARSKVELYAAIRRDVRAGLALREIRRTHRVGWETVYRAMGSAWPKERRRYPYRGSRLDPHKPLVDRWLREDLDAPRKQRHTVRRIFDRLVQEHGMTDVSYNILLRYARQRRPVIAREAGRAPVEVFVAQSHRPGQ